MAIGPERRVRNRQARGKTASLTRRIFGTARRADRRAHLRVARVAAKRRSPTRDYIRQIVTLVRQSADAAHALHEAGVLHRDIKPGNIQVTPDGSQAVLLDLGLAQLADDVEGRLTRTTQFVGTRRYASPEQQIDARSIDRRADVYSLGATLWELIALRPLFNATDETPLPELIARVQRDEPARLRSICPAVGRDLEAVVHKCLEKRPEHRYATAGELAEDLQRVLDGEPVTARAVHDWERAAKWMRRRPAQIRTCLLRYSDCSGCWWVQSFGINTRGGSVQQQAREAGERQARAVAIADALPKVHPFAVPSMVRELDLIRAESGSLLRERFAAASRFAYSVSLCFGSALPADPECLEWSLSYLQTASVTEILALGDVLRQHENSQILSQSTHTWDKKWLNPNRLYDCGSWAYSCIFYH